MAHRSSDDIEHGQIQRPNLRGHVDRQTYRSGLPEERFWGGDEGFQ
jgi:hypothetical protein